MTLTADVDGYSTPSRTYSSEGGHTYLNDLPGDVFLSNIVLVTFCFDKAEPPSGGDARELAAVVSMIGFEAL